MPRMPSARPSNKRRCSTGIGRATAIELTARGYEVIATPLTYLVINWLKRADHADAFDRHEDFNPFSFAEKDNLDA